MRVSASVFACSLDNMCCCRLPLLGRCFSLPPHCCLSLLLPAQLPGCSSHSAFFPTDLCCSDPVVSMAGLLWVLFSFWYTLPEYLIGPCPFCPCPSHMVTPVPGSRLFHELAPLHALSAAQNKPIRPNSLPSLRLVFMLNSISGVIVVSLCT